MLGLPVLASAEPLVKFPEGAAAWMVECRGLNGADPLPAAKPTDGTGTPDALNPKAMVTLKKVEVVQDSGMRCSITHWSNGKTRQTWRLNQPPVLLTEDPSGRALATRDALLFGDFFSEQAFSWIKPEFLQGKAPVSYEGRSCWHYKGQAPALNSFTAEEEGMVTYEAWIEEKTFLPVGLNDGEQLAVFTFKKSATTLKLPPKFQKRLDYYKTVMGMP